MPINDINYKLPFNYKLFTQSYWVHITPHHITSYLFPQEQTDTYIHTNTHTNFLDKSNFKNAGICLA